ncbi:DUF3667 domain-containing protein [Costertonia aggregata]|uniref:DUF3667 domain-containing protein n=1 Tax=Costertonia aggregata TaxID=343403 RepID=A0A7H9ART3_9FLAO|nr:DUF3667 domain-containing protein [Costertonia aggregata]QLG46201.1 DUF3667 domain-containing protein [Costertonia aggregata]
MECKNCNDALRTDYSFCPACGAKIIRNRLTVKNLSYDITERYFNIDNTFLRTFWQMFTKPEVVIGGYINGIRKKYLNPISYMGIALTLSGLIVFLMKKKSELIDFDVFGVGTPSEKMQPLFDFTTDYQALLFILYIPMMAAASWLAYDRVKYNFTERLTIFIYSLAQWSIFTFVPSILILLFYPEKYGAITFPMLGLMYLYLGYIIWKTSKITGTELIARILIFYVLFTIQYFTLSLLIPLFLILSGSIDFQYFAPKKIS